MRRTLIAVLIALLIVGAWVSGLSLDIHGDAQSGSAGLTRTPAASPTPRSTLASGRRTPSAHGAPSVAPISPNGLVAGRPMLPGTAGMPVSAHVASTSASTVTVVIPKLGIRAPVYDRGVDANGTLSIAPGYALTHLKFSAGLGTWGNYVLYGHDDIDHQILRYLPNMRSGDVVELDRGTSQFIYRVFDRQFVAASAVGLLDQTEQPILTLISCYPYKVDTQRIVVLASLIQVNDRASAK